MFDLFISYASYDRPWAERLYNDLRRRFPTIRIFWDRDPIALPPGTNWPAALEENARTTKHLVLLWSEKAKESNQVGPEFQAFNENCKTAPTVDGASRTLFYVPLQGSYGTLEVSEGFPDLRNNQTYSPAAADRGVSNLAMAPHRDEWQRIVRTIGDTVLAKESTQPVTLAVLVMDHTNVGMLDEYLDIKFGGSPTLKEFLTAAGLTLPEAKARYGDNAFAWMPFGPGRSIIDLMEELRVTVNQSLKRSYWFHWVPCDLADVLLHAPDDVTFRQRVDSLCEHPSAVVVDALSLFNPIVRMLFARLGDFAKKEEAMIVSLAPNEAPSASLLYQCLRANGAPVLDGYFLPQIPATGTFARCRVNVEHVSDIERLVRSSLGIYQLQRRKTEGMLDGFRMAETEIERCLPQLSPTVPVRERWAFLAVDELVTRGPELEFEHARLLHRLSLGAARGFKAWRLSRVLPLSAIVMSALGWMGAVRVLGVASWELLVAIVLMALVGSVSIAVATVVLWIAHRCRKSMTVIGTGLVMVTVGWLFARMHLWFFDGFYLRAGRVPRRSRPRDDGGGA